MPIHQAMQGAAFDAAAVKAMTSAFDEALREFSLNRDDPGAEVVARKIIECASLGERDAARLRELATTFLRE